MNAIDTNIWIYSHDVRDEHKRQKSQDLIANLEPMALLWQVGCEFVAAARKLEPFGFTRRQAWDALAEMRAMSDVVLFPDHELWDITCDLQKRLDLQYWDALIVAGCIRGGVRTMYSEDFYDGQEIDGVLIVNPFT